MTYTDIMKRDAKNRDKILHYFPNITEACGIYILTREDGDFKYAYVGQARHILTRLASHLSGFQHIDLSIKKHGFLSRDNPTGWTVEVVYCRIVELDEQERHWIKMMASNGYQLRNHTTGGQNEGKKGLDNNKSPKTYHDGVKYGELKARVFVRRLFDKYLTFDIKGTTNAHKEKAKEKFLAFMNTMKEEN